MGQEIKEASFRISTLSSIGDFLYEEHWPTIPLLKEGILETVNALSDYFEEGVHLYPEVILTTNASEFFKTISDREVFICEKELTLKEFKNILKLCAPLAVGSWVIYIDFAETGKVRYGLIDAEMSETSPSLYEQTVGSGKVKLHDIKIAYIRNIGGKNVELIGFVQRLIISLTLEELNGAQDNVVQQISDQISFRCEEKYSGMISTFINKSIEDAVKHGHGNLIGVIADDPDNIEIVKQRLSDGVYPLTIIDLCDFIIDSENQKTNQASVALLAYSNILKSMLNHDGITIITDRAKIIGYHVIIDFVNDPVGQEGGARSRAFYAMKQSGLFKACLYKSQDGNSKIWINE